MDAWLGSQNDGCDHIFYNLVDAVPCFPNESDAKRNNGEDDLLVPFSETENQ